MHAQGCGEACLRAVVWVRHFHCLFYIPFGNERQRALSVKMYDS